MRRFLYGSALFLFLSFLLLQSTSFSSTEMLNKATVSSVTESEALLSVHYAEGRLFWIANNTENVVQVRNTDSIAPNESLQIGPGRSAPFTILGHPLEISESIVIDVEWTGGYATIESFIPQSNIEQILLELLEEEEVELEIDGDEEIDEQDGMVTEQENEATTEEELEDLSLIDESEITIEIEGKIKE